MLQKSNIWLVSLEDLKIKIFGSWNNWDKQGKTMKFSNKKDYGKIWTANITLPG